MPVPNLMSSYMFLKHKFIFKASGYFSGLFFCILEKATWVTKGNQIENTKLTAECCMLAFSEHFLLTRLSSPGMNRNKI